MIRAFIPLACILVSAGAEAKADDKRVADADLQVFVEKRINDWQPTAEEKRFDEIGWCRTVLEAERLARQHQRPIFWFTHDGRMDVGRC